MLFDGTDIYDRDKIDSEIRKFLKSESVRSRRDRKCLDGQSFWFLRSIHMYQQIEGRHSLKMVSDFFNKGTCDADYPVSYTDDGESVIAIINGNAGICEITNNYRMSPVFRL